MGYCQDLFSPNVQSKKVGAYEGDNLPEIIAALRMIFFIALLRIKNNYPKVACFKMLPGYSTTVKSSTALINQNEYKLYAWA